MEEHTISSRRIHQGRHLTLRVDLVERADGHRATREIVEHPGAVAMLAWDGARLAMVRQWRHAAGQVLLEIPAGTLEPDEVPARTAMRELAEEVGLRAATWVEGPRFYTAPGFCTELMHLYLATDLSEATARAEDDEALEASWMSLDEVRTAVEDGRVMDAKTMVGVEWLARRLGR